MNDNQKKVFELFESFKHTSNYKDSAMMEIMGNREKFENNLNEMWAAVPRIGMSQMMEYRKAVEHLKSVGLKVMRNQAGDHKIVHKN